MDDPPPLPLSKRGVALEARVQRLFLALGVHAERSLPIRTGHGGQLATATDIDVLAVSYAPNFHRSIFHAECKSGLAARAFDRVFWLAGVRRLLAADRSLLVMPRYDQATSEFARQLDIETLHLDTVRGMEQAYRIPREWWPARSNFLVWDPLLKPWGLYALAPGVSDDLVGAARRLHCLATDEGWQAFSYGLLDRLLAGVREVGAAGARAAPEAQGPLHITRLAMSTALVRLAHVLLGVCRDLAGRQPAERAQRLVDRLTFGDHDADTLRQMVERSVALLRTALAEQHLQAPAGAWDAAHLLRVPEYQPHLLRVVQRLLAHPERTIYLPYAAEMLQFGYAAEPRGAVDAWVAAGKPALDDLKEFVSQALGVPATYLAHPSPRVLADTLEAARRDAEDRRLRAAA